MNKNTIISGLIVAIIIGGFLFNFYKEKNLGGSLSSDCDVTQSIIAVGNETSVTLVSAAGRRAWAVIQQPINATNTVTVSFDEGAAAISSQGFELSINDGDSASSTDEIIFGINTAFPYTGTVTGITAAASSTVSVITCNY